VASSKIDDQVPLRRTEEPDVVQMGVAVLRAGGDWEVLAVNDLHEECYATPALSEGVIYLRTAEALYAFASGPSH
jgi:hypothetical protein